MYETNITRRRGVVLNLSTAMQGGAQSYHISRSISPPPVILKLRSYTDLR